MRNGVCLIFVWLLLLYQQIYVIAYIILITLYFLVTHIYSVTGKEEETY
jgi:hypothetical protein